VISEFRAEPNTIERGRFTTLRWSIQGATEASIEPVIGAVQTAGTRQAYPTADMTDTLRAKGPGGTVVARVAVWVTVPSPAPAAPPRKTLTDRLVREVLDAHFDFDKSNLRKDAREILTMDASVLKGLLRDFPKASIVIEGHCAERGSAEYNIALGDRRARVSKEFLIEMGVPADRLKIVSYGRERPQCVESTQVCWQNNRRAHFTSGQ
jgi:peptidoglycan-associated lipoprotein